MRNSTKVPRSSSATRPRGRPRAFDESEALAALTATFWVRGFAAASLDELAASAGVNRPSLYAAFGDKRAMYLRALRSFAAELEKALGPALAPERPLADGLAALYRESIDLYLSGLPGPRGCLVVCTAPSAALDDPEIRHALADVLRAIDRVFERRFERAKEMGEVAAGADPTALALVASSALHGLAIRARAGESRATLARLAAAAVQLITGEVSARKARRSGRRRR